MTNRTCCACASRVINGFLEQLISEQVEASHSHPHNLSGNRSGPAPTCTSPVQLISFINNRDNNQICHIKYLIAEKLMTEAHGLAYYACSRGQAKWASQPAKLGGIIILVEEHREQITWHCKCDTWQLIESETINFDCVHDHNVILFHRIQWSVETSSSVHVLPAWLIFMMTITIILCSRCVHYYHRVGRLYK